MGGLFSNLGQYNKALVPIIVMLATFAANKWGLQLNIGPEEALVVVGIFTSFITYIVPNKTPAVTNLEIPTTTKISVDTVLNQAAESTSNILKTRKKVS